VGAHFAGVGRPQGPRLRIRATVPALMFIVVCGRSRRIMLSPHAKFSGYCKFIVFYNERLWSAPLA
jgi:hypothetical protein